MSGGKSNIIDQINFKERIFPIGRLDKNSTGLILLTNDGDIVNKILRKEHGHEKEYIVKVESPINQSFIERMSKPIPMLGTKTERYAATRQLEDIACDVGRDDCLLVACVEVPAIEDVVTFRLRRKVTKVTIFVKRRCKQVDRDTARNHIILQVSQCKA